MKLKRIILSLLAVVGFAAASQAQDIEGGVFLGTTSYQGDLTKPHITITQTKPSFGILGRYYFGPRINLKGNLYYGWIEGDDVDYDEKDQFRDRRNSSFFSSVLDLGIQGELNILPFISNSKRYRFAPYVFGGVSLYHFNPKAKDVDGNTVVLQPLGTEGQHLGGAYPKPYARWQGAIPYGVGVKYSLGNFWNIGFEVGQRKIFTDYLDDVSDRWPDMNALNAQNPKAAEMSARYDPTEDAYPKIVNSQQSYYDFLSGKMSVSGTPKKRGNDKREDMYVFFGFTLTKTLRRFSCTNF